jgi:hypothetical protein
MKFVCNYGPFKKDLEITPISEGRDYFVFSHKGTNYNVPKHCVYCVN